jgi:transposase
LRSWLRLLDERISRLDQQIAHRANDNEVARLLMTISGIGVLTVTALAPPAATFRRGRDFAAWLG